MRLVRGIFCVVLYIVFCSFSPAEPHHAADAAKLLDRLAGDWVLQGMIAAKQTTHDVQASWVLNHEYLELHEISREKNASGGAAYEAIVYMSWDVKAQQYTCLWLDSTSGGGLSAEGIARANPVGDSIPFIFTISPADQIHTTFSYDKTNDTWQWLIDNLEDGQIHHFANVTLKLRVAGIA